MITAAGTDPRVAGLVYICALAPDADETSQTLQDKFPKTDVFSQIELLDRRIWLKPDGIDRFAGDLPVEEQRLVWATHAAPDADLLNQKADGVAWRSKPSWYIVGTKHCRPICSNRLWAGVSGEEQWAHALVWARDYAVLIRQHW